MYGNQNGFLPGTMDSRLSEKMSKFSLSCFFFRNPVQIDQNNYCSKKNQTHAWLYGHFSLKMPQLRIGF